MGTPSVSPSCPKTSSWPDASAASAPKTRATLSSHRSTEGNWRESFAIFMRTLHPLISPCPTRYRHPFHRLFFTPRQPDTPPSARSSKKANPDTKLVRFDVSPPHTNGRAADRRQKLGTTPLVSSPHDLTFVVHFFKKNQYADHTRPDS